MSTQLSATPSPAAAAVQGYVPWDAYPGATIVRKTDGSAYAFKLTSIAIDADGAPNAYHPDDVANGCKKSAVYKGLDCPQNAGYPNDTKSWPGVIVADPNDPSKGYVQPATSACPGFFVAETSLSDHTKSRTDTARYVDARNVPYFVFPGKFLAVVGTGRMGDFGMAKNLATGAVSPFIVADVGQASAVLGEMSIALVAALGGANPNARTGTGAPKGDIAIIIFPNSYMTPAWPVSAAQMQTLANQKLAAAGGFEALTGLVL